MEAEVCIEIFHVRTRHERQCVPRGLGVGPSRGLGAREIYKFVINNAGNATGRRGHY